MATTVSLAKEQPRLEGVFGAISAEEDTALRTTFAAVDRELLDLAENFDVARAGWEGTGLELMWIRSGQPAISSFVGVMAPSGGAVDFCLELHPGWFYGNDEGVVAWDIEATIQADSERRHAGGMDLVWERGDVRRNSPSEAARELLAAARELKTQAFEHSLEHWIGLTRGE